MARGLPTGGQGSKVYVLCAEPKEQKHFRPGTRPGGSGTRSGGSTEVTEKLFMCQMFMCQMFMCLFRPLEKPLDSQEICCDTCSATRVARQGVPAHVCNYAARFEFDNCVVLSPVEAKTKAGQSIFRKCKTPFHLEQKIRQEIEHEPKLLCLDIFRWGGGLPRERVGAKKRGMSLETQRNQIFGGGMFRDFCPDIPGAPEKFERKKFVFNFCPLKEGDKTKFLANFHPGTSTDNELVRNS